jgi:hypothetical protein
MKSVSVLGFVMLSALAGPLAAQGSGGGQGQPAARPTTTLHKQIEAKGGGTSDDGAAQVSARLKGAKANEARTNSAAARSGEINGRNALTPAGQPEGPSGAPQVGSGH